MYTDKELASFIDSGLKRQGWTIYEDEQNNHAFILTHNEHWINGFIELVEWEDSSGVVQGIHLYLDISEEDFEYLTYDEYFENLPSLKVRLQRILDDWRDVHKPIFNGLFKLLKLREIVVDEENLNSYPRYKAVAEKVCTTLNTINRLEYYNHE